MTWLGSLAALLLTLGHAAVVRAQGAAQYVECVGGSPPPESVAASAYVVDFSWSQNITEGAGERGIASFNLVNPVHNTVIRCRAADELLAFVMSPGLSLSQFNCDAPNPVLAGGEHASFSLGLPPNSNANPNDPVRTLTTYITWQCKDRMGTLYEQTLATPHELSLTCANTFPTAVANACTAGSGAVVIGRGQVSTKALPVGTACAASSFVNPEWEISDFAFSSDIQLDFGPGTVGSASFDIRNSATGAMMKCVAMTDISSLAGWETQFSVIDGMVWYRCSSGNGVQTAFSYDAANNELKVRQRWMCDGSGPETPINFEAVGSVRLPQLNCSQMEGRSPGEVACQPVAHLNMPAMLTLPVSLGHYEAPNNPTRDRDFKGCTKASQFGSVAWTVENVNFTVLGDATRSKVNFTFDITNDAIGYSRSCYEMYETVGSFDWIPYPDPDTWLSCGTDADALQAGVFTWFRYDNYTNTLGIKQEWYCNDENPMQPQNFTASGDMDVHLNCRLTGYSRGSASQGDRFTGTPFVPLIHCSSMDAEVQADVVDQSDLPVAAATKFEMPMSGSCTINSFTNPRRWTVTSLRARYETSGNGSDVSLSGYFSGPQFGAIVQNGRTGCTSASGAVGSTQWQQCPADEGGNGYSYRIQRSGNESSGYTIQLAVNGTWTCSDRDPTHPIQFWGYGVKEIPVTCVDTSQASGPNVTECRSTEGQFTVEISDLQWNVASQGAQQPLSAPSAVPAEAEEVAEVEEVEAVDEPEALEEEAQEAEAVEQPESADAPETDAETDVLTLVSSR